MRSRGWQAKQIRETDLKEIREDGRGLLRARAGLLSCADNRSKGNAQAGFGLDLQFTVATLKTFLSAS